VNVVIATASADETRRLGETLARLLHPGDLLALSGELGAGKTVFVQGLAAGLGSDPSALVTSPTFVILHEYPGPIPLFHFDFYRLGRPEEVLALGFEEYVEDEGICAVEWAEKFPGLFAGHALWLRFERVGEEERRIEFSAGPALAGRWPALAAALGGVVSAED
jgi:tRNA threonylcarbamoyladenosine biosynthesis protein TsaE